MKKILFIPVLLLGLHGICYGQEQQEVVFTFASDTVSVEQGKTLSNFLVLRNNSREDIPVTRLAADYPYPGLLFAPDTSLLLAAGETKRMPLKFIANLDFLKMKEERITFSINYNTHGMEKKQSTSFFINRQEEKEVAMYPFSTENYMDPNVPETTISFFLENKSYAARQVKLTFLSNPDGLPVSAIDPIVQLEGKEKKLIEIKASVRRQSNSYPDYLITVKAEDIASHEQVGSTYIKVIVLGHSRQMRPYDLSDRERNSLELAYSQMNQGLAYAQLQGNGAFNLPKNIHAQFNTAIDYYPDLHAGSLYNTWLTLANEKTALKLGNISGTGYDYSINGRGLQFNYKLNDQTTFELIGSENNYNLYTNYFPQLPGSKTLAGAYRRSGENGKTEEINYVYNHDPRLNTNTHLVNSATSFVLDSIHSFRLEGGFSNEQGRISDQNKYGITGGLNYQVNYRKWRINLSNNYSSPFYSGLKRGALNLNESVSYDINPSYKTFFRYQNSVYQPQYLNEPGSEGYGIIPTLHSYYFYFQILETGVNFTKNKFNFLISPQILQQKSITRGFDNQLSSYRLRFDISTAIRSQSLSFSSEYGYSKAASGPDWFNSLRIMVSYRYKSFSINGMSQYNPQNVSDFNRKTNPIEGFNNYTLYSAYSFEALGGKLKSTLSGGLNYSGLYKNFNQHISGNLEYKIAANWSATGNMNYTNFNSINSDFTGNNMQFRIGIKKYFINATRPGNNKVNLQLFHDQNDNGVLDKDEKIIPREIIKLNNFIALTDKNGKVIYQNVPDGEYKIKINDRSGLKLAVPPTIQVDHNTYLKIPMTKDNALSGKLQEIRQEYDSRETNVSGISVYAKNEAGTIFSTIVDMNNEFEFFLKDGTYEVYVENDRYNFTNAHQKITLKSDDKNPEIIFEYKKKNTEIKVKRF